MSNKVYTKTGDKGTTGLFGGKRVSKDDVQIEAYGNVDELNSFIGLLRDLINESGNASDISEQLIFIQDRLFSIGAHLATDIEKIDKVKEMLPPLYDEDIKALETAIDKMEEELEPMKSFILPGGHLIVSYCHICRCVCRRAERSIIAYARESKEIEPHILPFMNRLSDYLFVLARYFTQKLNAREIPWVPKR
ncbi:MAG: cob(I)yrinic acid a,c-diamide adenosyltransferase [Bacteroidia bacterium]